MNTLIRPTLYRHFHRMAWLAAFFTASTIVFGSFVRLSDAGMSCPDWPTCYGRITWPTTQKEASTNAAIKIRPLETQKAWKEQVHRFLASALGLESLILVLLVTRRHRKRFLSIIVAAGLVLLSIPLYIYGLHPVAFITAALGEGILLTAAYLWSNKDLSRVAVLVLAVVIFQALLGMWTVTMLLQPIVVMGHLMGAFCMFSLLTWMACRATGLWITVGGKHLRWLVRIGLTFLVIQIALGGWVSANYASLACGGGSWSIHNFPQCVGHWWPTQDYADGLTLTRSIGVDYEGGVLDGPARIAIQMLHRMWALATVSYLIGLCVYMWRLPGLRSWTAGILIAVLIQTMLGILNVKLALPLLVGVMHNAGAVALTYLLISLLARMRAPE